ncbi:MAG: phosphoribosylanthranilate isomerase [Luteitalea sp.]|nr:phosphoribosylanthranilate isomerase [Luteitalea sp.]
MANEPLFQSASVAVKICGVTRPQDAALAAALGASAIGLVFWPNSPRAVTMPQARSIVDAVPPFTTVVGVFVDQPMEEVIRMAVSLGLGAVQLHGHESVDHLQRIPCRVIKALDVGEYATSEWVSAPRERVTILLDAIDPVRRGGTGQQIDWRAAARIAGQRRVILSGGLRPDNVAEAIGAVRPYAVDVASGVERAPGVKDHDRMRAFMDAVCRP